MARAKDAQGNGVAAFTLNGSPWVSKGWNDYRIMHHPVIDEDEYGACSDQAGSENFSRQMDRIQATGANTIRTWFFQEYYTDAPTNDRWRAFLRVLEGAKNRGMKVVPVLSNQYAACDRANDYYDPTQNDDANTRTKKERDGTLNTEYYRTGYRQPAWGYEFSLRDWAVKVAKRFNPDSGYASTIAYFQIVNEAEALTFPNLTDPKICNSDGSTVLRAFADDMTAVVKSAYVDGATNRAAPLVSLGTMGIGQCGQSPAPAPADPSKTEYAYIHAGAVDMCELHDYDAMNEAWPVNIYGITGNSFANRKADCGSKPLVIGEAGIRTNVSETSRSTQEGAAGYDKAAETNADTLARRARFFSNKMSAALNDNQVDGYQLWDKLFLKSTDKRNTDLTLNRGDGYGIGAPGDPTTCVFRAFTPASNCPVTAQPPVGAPDDGIVTHFGFEEDQGGWRGDWPQGNVLGVGRSTYRAHEGSWSLGVSLTSSPSQTYAGVATYTGLDGLDPGTPMTAWVYSASDTAGAKVQLFVKNLAFNDTKYGPITTLSGSGWQQIAYTVDSTISGVGAVGVQFLNEVHKVGGVQVDEIRW